MSSNRKENVGLADARSIIDDAVDDAVVSVQNYSSREA
jgi:hypothetical protein